MREEAAEEIDNAESAVVEATTVKEEETVTGETAKFQLPRAKVCGPGTPAMGSAGIDTWILGMTAGGLVSWKALPAGISDVGL